MTKQNAQHIGPVIIGCIGGFTGALVVGVLHHTVDLYGRANQLSILLASNGIFRYLFDMAVAFVTAFLLFLILYRREEKSGEVVQKEFETTVREMEMTGIIYSPLQGQVIPMEEVPDDTFAAKVLGDGMAVIPSEGIVYAPFDGWVEKVYDAKHAISISSMDGIELLIHVGIGTEELAGKFYEIFVSDGDQIQRGERLLGFDMAGMKEAGYSTVTPVIVTNSDDYDVIYLEGNGVVDQQDILMKV